MSTIKVSELNLPELDYWVAKAGELPIENSKAYPHCVVVRPKDHLTRQLGYIRRDGKSFDGIQHAYSPSTDWSQGGPIIERERISTEYWVTELTDRTGEPWQAYPHIDNPIYTWGATSLIAAMRAYVASKFGETVDD